MVIETLLNEAAQVLAKNKITSPRLDAAVLICHVLKCSRSHIISHNKDEVDSVSENIYRGLIEKRANGEPVAYLMGTKEFMSLEFCVNEHVLIPRADTETLVEHIIEENNFAAPKIADLCSGSGCIGVSLAHYIADAHVVMADISADAIKTAEQNSVKNAVSDRCGFVCTDLLRSSIDGIFDIAVSNPPYIETGEIDALERDVAEYEPRLALDGGADGLVFYRRLVQTVPYILRAGGLFALEVGHMQADIVAKLFENDFCDIKTVCDIAGIRRVVSGRRKQNF